MATLSKEAVENLHKLVQNAVANPSTDLPGTSVCVVNRNGDTLFSEAAGKRGLDSSEDVTTDSVFWIASCTKMITGIAAMQLVEQGKLSLDDSDLLEKLCPELKVVKQLQKFENGQPVYRDKTKSITLRMLLTHTAGFGYTFFNPNLAQWYEDEKKKGNIVDDEFSGEPKDIMLQPLIAEPGAEWNYGVNIDWAGVAVERASGLSLNDFMVRNIFNPLNLQNITMFPTAAMKSKLVHMHQRDLDGTLRQRKHIMIKALSDDPSGAFNSGGAGCFATPANYCAIIATLLNDGTSPTTGAKILSAESIKEMFTNQIPHMPDFARIAIPDARAELTNSLPELYPQPKEQPQGWGLTFMITVHETAFGRGANGANWAGLANLFWWADREKGVGGMVATQILPFGDGKVLGLWVGVESEVYKGLQSA